MRRNVLYRNKKRKRRKRKEKVPFVLHDRSCVTKGIDFFPNRAAPAQTRSAMSTTVPRLSGVGALNRLTARFAVTIVAAMFISLFCATAMAQNTDSTPVIGGENGMWCYGSAIPACLELLNTQNDQQATDDAAVALEPVADVVAELVTTTADEGSGETVVPESPGTRFELGGIALATAQGPTGGLELGISGGRKITPFARLQVAPGVFPGVLVGGNVGVDFALGEQWRLSLGLTASGDGLGDGEVSAVQTGGLVGVEWSLGHFYLRGNVGPVYRWVTDGEAQAEPEGSLTGTGTVSVGWRF